MKMKKLLFYIRIAIIIFAVGACSKKDESVDQEYRVMQERLWQFGMEHPDGFTLDLRNWSQPAEGICVSYEETQNSFTYSSLYNVIVHSMQHDGYVGGWRDEDDKYYFDSDKLFPEDSLEPAISFAKRNHQRSIYILSCDSTIWIE